MLLVAAAAALGGCGGGSSEGSTDTGGPSPATTGPSGGAASEAGVARYARQAEEICRRSRAETEALGRELARGLRHGSPGDPLASSLIRPGIAILSRESARLRALGRGPAEPSVETFVGLFDPILELARQRLELGAAGERSRGQELELLIDSLADEQSAAARDAGLDACAVGFTSALETG